MAQPVPAFQNRWMPVATIDSSPSSIRSVRLGGLWYTVMTGRYFRAPVRVSWERTWSPGRMLSIALGPARVWTVVPAAKQEW
jgi:hypothetical protein